MTSRLRALAVLSLVLLAVAGAWNHDLWIYDEPREAELARVMARAGRWVVMELGGRPFLDKPPLFCVSVALAFRAFGASPLVGRLVVAGWALATLAVTAWFARRVVGPRSGLLAALVLATTYRFYSVSREILLDNALLTFTTAGIAFGFVAARERRRGLAVVAALALAGAFLTKGLVGVGIAGLVLLIDLVWNRDRDGLLTLLHPVVVLAFLGPVAVYVGLVHAADPDGWAFLREILWSNQLGRFTGAHGQKSSGWYLYLVTWPEMLAVWTPAAIVAIGLAAREEQDRVVSFLLIWALAPLVFLSFSRGRARPYALPVLPGYACLIAWAFRSVVGTETGKSGDALVSLDLVVVRWAKRILVAAVAVGGAVVAVSVLAIGVASPGELDALEIVGAALALLGGCGVVVLSRRAERESVESAAILAALVVVGGFLVFSGSFMARRGDRQRSYRPLAEEVLRQAHARRLMLFHVSNSYSGMFAFAGDRTTPEFDEAYDPRGEHLLAELGAADADVVLAPDGAFGTIDSSRRGDIAVEWSGSREDDTWRRFVLGHRRRAEEPAAH